MPEQVLVVKRARRRAFAMVWAASVWLRSVWRTLGRSALAEQQERVQERMRAAAGRAQPLAIPRLRVLLEGGHGCTGCGLCPPVCPSGALDLARIGSGESVSVIRFDLNLGACIGCGRCVAVCPENALESVDAPRAVAALADGTPPLIDLLALGEK